MIIYYGNGQTKLLTLSYTSNSTQIVTGCIKPQLMRIYLEGINNGWNEDSYFVIQSEFGTSERISLTGKLSTSMFFHFSYGILPETIISNCQDYYDLDNSPKILHIDSKACNDEDLLTFSITNFPDLIYLWIESSNFKNVSTFEIRDNTHLEYIYIQDNAFTHTLAYDLETSGNETRSKSFHILNCNELISIDIGKYSFNDFGGEFELKNLPKLQYINIGSIGNYYYSSNFYSSSFIIRGIQFSFLYSFISIDLPSLQTITLGDSAFYESKTTIIESIQFSFLYSFISIDLPQLQSINLGSSALIGYLDDSYPTLLQMRSNNNLNI